MHIDAVRDPRTGEITHYVGCFSDISERKSIEDRISFLAHHDPLTGLSNRFSLDAVLPQSIAMARRNEQQVALLFVDLDHFKEINDNHGHSTGDQVLIEVGRRLMNSVRESDFLARIGGDEFVILLNEIQGTDDALRVASSVLEALHRPIIAGGEELTITPSIGISLFPEDGEEAATLLGCADNAMYRVKTDGRDGYRFHSSTAA
jgi:diguanylate cyclase (GGDEF)-like protein